MLEWFLRTDLFTPAAFSQIISMPLKFRILWSRRKGEGSENKINLKQTASKTLLTLKYDDSAEL
jgi:hypothetical protein